MTGRSQPGRGVLHRRSALPGRRPGALQPGPPAISPADSASVRDARDALKLRYAHGQISREEYLQGKVELED